MSYDTFEEAVAKRWQEIAAWWVTKWTSFTGFMGSVIIWMRAKWLASRPGVQAKWSAFAGWCAEKWPVVKGWFHSATDTAYRFGKKHWPTVVFVSGKIKNYIWKKAAAVKEFFSSVGPRFKKTWSTESINWVDFFAGLTFVFFVAYMGARFLVLLGLAKWEAIQAHRKSPT